MSDNNKIKNFFAEDIEKYHKDLLSPKERHDLEKAALDDPFLADALEGYKTAGVNISEDIAELNQRLSEKTDSSKVIPFDQKQKPPFAWLRIAAIIVVIAGAGFLVYQFAFDKGLKEIAENKPEEKNVAVSPDSFQNNMTQKTEIKPESTANKTGIKNQTKGSVVNETMSSGLSSKKADTVTFQSLNTQPLSIAPSDDMVAKQNPKTEAQDKDATEKKEVTRRVLNDKNSLSETIVVKKMPDKKTEAATEQSGNNNEYAFNKAKTLSSNSITKTIHNNVFRGRITDAKNNPLPFSNISNTKDSIGTYADAKGYFTLTSPDSVLNVRIQSLGFTNTVATLRSNDPTNKVVLQEDDKLDAIVLSRKKPNTTRFVESNFNLQESEPADGWENYDTYLANNLQMPETIKMKQSRGEVEVSFEVDKNGEPINIKVEKSLCAECDKEAIRLIKAGPKWIRHSKNGRVKITVAF